jgi:hypothetical protein
MAGDIGFDPLQISDLVPLSWAREAELKHARVCMLAVTGWVVVDLGFTVPFAPKVRCARLALRLLSSGCSPHTHS